LWRLRGKATLSRQKRDEIWQRFFKLTNRLNKEHSGDSTWWTFAENESLTLRQLSQALKYSNNKLKFKFTCKISVNLLRQLYNYRNIRKSEEHEWRWSEIKMLLLMLGIVFRCSRRFFFGPSWNIGWHLKKKNLINHISTNYGTNLHSR